MTIDGARVLVVDDDPGVVAFLVEMLALRKVRAEGATSAAEALERVAASEYDLVISDVEMPGMRGTELLTALQARRPSQLVILITAFGSIDLAVQTLKAGACDFLPKPFPIEALYAAVERALRERWMRREIVRLRQELRGPQEEAAGVVARSPAMKRVLELAERAARTESTVLLTGESGTGKSSLARFIHTRSARRERPLVHVNCAALPASLLESELFGAAKGAFTDARTDRPGLFVEAHRGTLFLDEVGELPLESQPKLLHALEAGKVRPVGGRSEVEVDTRLIAATNRPLEEALKARTFRPDLYFRLNVIRIDVPPLRARQEDVTVLVDLFLERAARRTGRQVLGVEKRALNWLMRQPWPGNARELANLLERAVATTDHDTLLLEDLTGAAAPEFAAEPGGREGLPGDDPLLPLAEVEQRHIQRVLEHTGGNMSEAARILGIDRRTLYRRVQQEGPGGETP